MAHDLVHPGNDASHSSRHGHPNIRGDRCESHVVTENIDKVELLHLHHCRRRSQAEVNSSPPRSSRRHHLGLPRTSSPNLAHLPFRLCRTTPSAPARNAEKYSARNTCLTGQQGFAAAKSAKLMRTTTTTQSPRITWHHDNAFADIAHAGFREWCLEDISIIQLDVMVLVVGERVRPTC